MAHDVLLTIGIEDIVGATKTINVFFPAATTLAQVQGWATSALVNLSNFEFGVIKYADVTLPITLPGGIGTAPVAGSTVRRGGLMSFDNPTRYSWDQYIPAIDTTVLVGTDIDITNTDVAAWITAMTTGISVSGTFIQPTNGSGEDLTALRKATETFRK